MSQKCFIIRSRLLQLKQVAMTHVIVNLCEQARVSVCARVAVDVVLTLLLDVAVTQTHGDRAIHGYHHALPGRAQARAG